MTVTTSAMVVLILNAWNDDINVVSLSPEFFKSYFEVNAASPLFQCETRLIAGNKE